MTHKQQFSNLTLPQKGVIFSRILLLGVAAAATSVVTMVAPRSAVAQNSPVSPTVVNPTSPGTPSIGGTAVSETTTTETTTTTGETTTTTTTTVTETTTTTTNTETEVGVEATTAVVDDAVTNEVPPEAVQLEVVQEAVPQNTGAIMTTAADTSTPTAAPTQQTPAPQPAAVPQQQAAAAAPQQQAAATSTVVEQFIFGTTIETVYMRGLAGRLGTSQEILVQTRVFQVVTGLSGDQTAVLQAFQAALERAGILNLASFNNAGFADLIANSGNAQLAIEIFSRLAVNRLMLLSRLGGLSSLSARRGLVGVRFAQVTITQYVVYQGLGVRFPGFPEERKK